MTNYNKFPRNIILIASAAGGLTLAGCGAPIEESQKALQNIVTENGYDVLDSGTNQLGGMIYHRVAVGTDCVADVWGSANETDFEESMGEDGLTVKVYVNPGAGDVDLVDAFKSNGSELPTFEQLIARPLVTHSCFTD
jgi:hypothetical protein